MVALPLALNGLPRGVLDLGNLWGSGAAKLGVDHLRFPPELANGIRDHLLLRHLLYYVVVGNDVMVAVGVGDLHEVFRFSFAKQTWWMAGFQKTDLPSFRIFIWQPFVGSTPLTCISTSA